MPWVEQGDFERLAAGELRDDLERCESVRKKAVGRFWTFAVLAVIAAAAAAVGVTSLINGGAGLVVGVIVLVFGLIFAATPLNRAKNEIKAPVCQAVARQQGLTWSPGGGMPPEFAEAQRLLFGSATSRTFGDHWSGQIEGRPFSVYEATLTQKSGKSTVTLFSGQVWRLASGRPWSGITLAVPDRGVFNFFKPQGGMERLRFPDDPPFEKVFEVYSHAPAEAQALFSPEVRSELTDFRNTVGRTWVYLGGDDVLVAISGKDRFEPGSMFKSTPPADRARAIWTEVDGAVGFARRLSAAFPQR